MAFLAHEDIRLSPAWVATIMAELHQCDIFVQLLTKRFQASRWTDQETGVALALEKLIVPLRVDVDPYGFVGSIQAVTLRRDSPNVACRRVVSALLQHRVAAQGRFLEGFIPNFSESETFDRAGHYASVLLECEQYSAEQVQKVFRAIIDNR